MLLPEQVSKFWDIIKYAIEQSLPPITSEHPDKMNRILSAALSGKVSVWVSHVDHKINGIVLTTSTYDDISGTKNLLIYCVYGYTRVDKDSWLKGLTVLTKYAKAKRFSRIVAYTNVDYIVNMVNSLGGNSEYRFISFDVDKIVQNLNKLNGDTK